MRRNYVDNLRWSAVSLLIVYHAAMAWNTWDEPNYIFFEGNRAVISIVVFLSPFLMPLLFALAGMSSRYALAKRTERQYLAERVRRLLIPFVFGTVTVMPVMSWLADRFNCGYTGSLLSHYKVFFTKFTDLTGGDGGFSVGHFWFLLFLFVISVIFIVIRRIGIRCGKRFDVSRIPVWGMILLGLPLLPLHEVLQIGGKSIAEYLYMFMAGYYLLSDDRVTEKLSKCRWLLLGIGLAAGVLDTYLFLWADQSAAVRTLNTAARWGTEWFTVLGLISTAGERFNMSNSFTRYMSQRSFMFYILHYVWIVLFQYLLGTYSGCGTAIMFFAPIVPAYAAAFVSCEICIRIPPLRFLMGTRRKV
ncbi:MAG: acyltransferase [Ruminococcus sp.]|nr:acyltransferase [Ruminococcus sp.]